MGKFLLRPSLNYSHFQVSEIKLCWANLLIIALPLLWISAWSSVSSQPEVSVVHDSVPPRHGESLFCLCLRDHVYWDFKWFHSLCTVPPAFLIGQKVACFNTKFWNLISASDIHGWVYLPFSWVVPQITPVHLHWARSGKRRGCQAEPWLYHTENRVLPRLQGSRLLSAAFREPQEIH